MSNGVPEHVIDTPVIPRTTSDDMTRPMHMIEHRVSKQDGPPPVPESWDEYDTDVDVIVDDTIVVDVEWPL